MSSAWWIQPIRHDPSIFGIIGITFLPSSYSFELSSVLGRETSIRGRYYIIILGIIIAHRNFILMHGHYTTYYNIYYAPINPVCRHRERYPSNKDFAAAAVETSARPPPSREAAHAPVTNIQSKSMTFSIIIFCGKIDIFLFPIRTPDPGPGHGESSAPSLREFRRSIVGPYLYFKMRLYTS